MTIKVHAILQSLLSVLQVASVYGGAFPKAQPYITLGLTVVQAGLAFIAHYVNPDGTPASVGYIPPKP